MRQGKAKHLIFVHFYGGPSQVDTFDYKPELFKQDGKTAGRGASGEGAAPLLGPRWQFRPYGECGRFVSDLFPYLGHCADRMAFVHSLRAEAAHHEAAVLALHTGSPQPGAPSLGATIAATLKSESQVLPGFVVLPDESDGLAGGAANWSAGKHPVQWGGVPMALRDGVLIAPAPNPLAVGPHAAHEPAAWTEADAVRAYRANFSERLQAAGPELARIDQESASIRELYGLEDPRCASVARRCVLARRLVERGVRVVQLHIGGGKGEATWDAHEDVVRNHSAHARRCDRPLAALLLDLEQRGLLAETLVVGLGEFGRDVLGAGTKGRGRDHNPHAFTAWMAGGGVRGGHAVGATDELGRRVATAPHTPRELHATIRHLMGIDSPSASGLIRGLIA